MSTTYSSLGGQIIEIHGQLRQSWTRLTRIAVALYDPVGDTLQTFVSSTVGGSSLVHYETLLSQVPSLQQLAESGNSRVIDDLQSLSTSAAPHTRCIIEAGFRSSLTVPLKVHGHFIGFLFFDADTVGYFDAVMQHHLKLYAQLIGALVAAELIPLRTLSGAVAAAQHFSRFRDQETAGHQSRIAHLSRHIAFGVADLFGLDDEYIQFIFQFAPLHDVGKVAIPDRVLMKQGRLDAAEQQVMRQHVQRGVELVDTLISEFRLERILHIDVLRNIVATHHEFYDGTGYPQGMAGDNIPPEGRIVTVADVFDALVSKRPYKQAWELDQTMEYMLAESGSRFDPACVDALFSNTDRLYEILQRWSGDPI